MRDYREFVLYVFTLGLFMLALYYLCKLFVSVMVLLLGGSV